MASYVPESTYCKVCGGRELDPILWNDGGHLMKEERMDGQPRLDGKKFDEGKPQLGLISIVFLWAIARVLTHGREKYGAHNWRAGLEWSRPYDALQRHLTAWWDGEATDKDSGFSHLWLAACELMFLVEYETKGAGKDDRYITIKPDSTST